MGRMDYCKQFAEKVFGGATTKDAYMKAVKWYASNIIANDKLSGVKVEFIKNKTQPKVLMRLYASLPDGEITEQHCACCREMHHAFFINQENDCNRCNMLGYKRRVDQKMNVKVNYCREQTS